MKHNLSDWQKNLSYQKHKKQRFWRILFPVGLGIVVILILAALIILTAAGGDGTGKISSWADASTIWLILPILVFAVFAAVFLFLLIYLVGRAIKILPPYTAVIQHYGRMIAKQTRVISDKLVAPMIATQSLKARAQAFFKALTGRST